MKKIYLSHFLSEQTPGYGGRSSFSRSVISDMSCGGSCNQQEWTISNHIGTHIDCPKHFSINGKTIDSYDPDFWFCISPILIDYNAKHGELINLDIDLISENCDCLLIRTGFEQKRSEDAYWAENPGIAPEFAELLRNKRPNLKFIGFDFISVTSYMHRPVGRISHKALLDPDLNGKPILPIEDMKLSGVKSPLKSVSIYPILIENADGGQVTVVCEVE